MKSVIGIIILILCLHITSAQYTIYSSEENYIINSSQCKIPDLPPFSANLETPVNRSPIPCTTFDQLLTKTSVKNGIAKLHIKEEVVAKYFGTDKNITCCYSYVFRKGTVDFPDVGITQSSCRVFQNEVYLFFDTVWVSCAELDHFYPDYYGFPLTPVYENIHQVVRLKENVNRRTNSLIDSTKKKPISVLMIVIDSVSRLNFIRTMPKTRNFVMENGFYEFYGYNKVDDNTFPNAMAFLTGMNLKDSLDICKPTEIEGLTNCPFIWNKYRNVGYATAYAEDWSQIATFNYLKKGFRYSPTDYYFKPYMDAITYLKSIEQDTMPFCAGPESQGSRVLNLAYDFAKTFIDLPSFGIFWMNTFSHNDINTPRTMDETVKSFFQRLQDSGILDESIVFFLSDHGVRFGDIIKTPRGYYEVRLPMNYISLPSWFKETYPEATSNFKANTRKLTSNYDLYMTLQHILVLSGTRYTPAPSLQCPNCKSFLQKIQTERSCSDAGIPPKWCLCNVNITEAQESP